jgi:hypothetical protein
MSTRSNISIKRKDGTYDKIYCHSDGYLEYNGRILDMFYKDEEKINNLINLGDISLLGFRVNPDPTIIHSFEYDERQEGVTVAYGRDRNESNVDKKTYQNEKAFLDSFKDTWCEYVYLYDEENKKWLYSEIPYGNEKNLNFVSLHNALKEKNLIDPIDEKFDSLIRKQVDFAYDYDTYSFKDAYESYEDAYFEAYNFLSKEKGVKNFIITNKSMMDNIEDDLDDPEMKKLFDRGLALNEDLRNYRKEKFRNLENDDIEI